jgi:multicomponent Na+:H+ antiporter subunit C
LIYALTGSALVALGVFGVITQAALLRKILAFNLLGGGVFLLFGVIARRGAVVDAVPQALVITGLVVAFAATALAIVLVLRMFQITGAATIAEDPPA